jgi:hypothetical protein
MGISTQAMTSEQMKSVVIEYFMDPDYSAADTDRHRWLRQPAEIPA